MSDKETGLREAIEAAYEATVEQSNEVSEQEPNIEEHGDKSERSTGMDRATEKADSSNENRHSDNDLPEKDNSSQNTEESSDEPSSLEAPTHWAPEDIEAYNELDDKSKRLYLKRYKQMEAGYTKKAQKFAEERRIAEKFNKAVEPFQDQFKKLNIDEFDAFQRAATAHIRLLQASPQEKYHLFQRLAHDYGINFNQQQVEQAINHNQPQLDPHTQALLQEVESIKQRQYQIDQAQIQREYQSLEQQIVNFREAKDDKGEPKYPHFETLRLEMSEILQKGMAKSLEDAYEKAIRLNDDLHQEYINRQYNSRLREADVEKKTAASKKAGFNVRGSGSISNVQPQENLTIRQLAERAYDKQTKRQRI